MYLTSRGGRCAITVLAVTALALCLPWSALWVASEPEDGPHGRQVEMGDWEVTGDEVRSGETFVLTGNLTVGPTGRLTLDMCEVVMNLSQADEFSIVVEDGGVLKLMTTQVSSPAPHHPFDIVVSGTLSLTSSTVEHSSTIVVDGGVLSAVGSQMSGGDPVVQASGNAVLGVSGGGIVAQVDGQAVRSQNSTIAIANATIETQGGAGSTGLELLEGTSAELWYIKMRNFTKGIVFKGDGLEMEGSSVSSSVVDLDVHSANVTLSNTTLEHYALDTDSSISFWWDLDVLVKGPDGKAAAGTAVTVTSARGEELDLMTDGNGWVRGLNLLEKVVYKFKSADLYSPYTIEAGNATAFGRIGVELSSSGMVTVPMVERDLYVLDLSVDKDYYTVGELVGATVVVATTVFPLRDVEVVVLADGEQFSNTTINITSGQLEFGFKYLANETGYHEIGVELDPYGAVEDVDRDNNGASIDVTVIDDGPLLPDLEFLGLGQTESSGFGGTTVTFEIDVQNTGMADARDVKVSLYVDGDFVDSERIVVIKAGGVGRVNIDWAADSGNHTVKVVLDPDNEIAESDEGNNIRTVGISVGGGDGGFGFFDDETMIMCLSFLVMVVIILILMAAMAKKSRPSTGARPPTTSPPPYTGATPPPGVRGIESFEPSEPVVTGSGRPRRTPTVRRDGTMKEVGRAGALVCKRCGGSNIKVFDDGHKQCKDCRKIFF